MSFPEGFDTRKDKATFVVAIVVLSIFCVAAAAGLLLLGGWALALGMNFVFVTDFTIARGVGLIALAYLLTFFTKLVFK